MEDDRDRQKKAREESWMRPIPDLNVSPIDGKLDDADTSEFYSAWRKSTNPLTDADYELFAKYKVKLDLSRKEYNSR